VERVAEIETLGEVHCFGGVCAEEGCYWGGLQVQGPREVVEEEAFKASARW
jgi:hypothetical protein